ncbi:hypothetical protein [Pseudoxanthomonas gei]|uniref:hypothetical protein n=1 Tax=Pseudoxanthomonas gei TaxID=1383030 RepID=UPI0013908A80|nr:hypothetical protein [Pseudoxanthomonas gei]
MRKLIAIALCLLGFLSSANGAELPVGPMLFKLGTSQASVMTEVAARFRVIPVTGSPDMFFLSDKNAPSANVIGGISFKNGRLSWVQRNWGSFDGSARADEGAKALYSAIESATTATGSSASISTKINRVPGTEFRSTYFEFPGHKVSITVTDGDSTHGGKQVTVDESISQ